MLNIIAILVRHYADVLPEARWAKRCLTALVFLTLVCTAFVLYQDVTGEDSVVLFPVVLSAIILWIVVAAMSLEFLRQGIFILLKSNDPPTER